MSGPGHVSTGERALGAPAVPARKRWLVYAVLGALVGGHLVDVALRREHWPFSNYPMWARASTEWRSSDLRLHGVVAGGGGDREVALNPAHFRPLPQLQLAAALRSALGQADRGDPALLRRRAADLLAYYEARRQAGRHDGPALAALRVYVDEWEVNRAADNVDRPHTRLIVDTAEAPPAPPPAPTSAGQARAAAPAGHREVR